MKWPVRIVASFAVAGLLLVLLMVWGEVSPVDVFTTVRRVPPRVYLFALALHVFTYSMRAIRLRVLIPEPRKPSFQRSLILSAAHNMASYVLPAKTGEASLVVYLRVKAGVPPSVGLAALLVARFLDAAMLSLGLSAACFYLHSKERFVALDWLGTAGGALVALATVFVVFSLRGDLLVRAVELALRWIRLHHWNWGERLLVKTNSLAHALRASSGHGRLRGAALATAPLWMSVFGFYTVLARAMGMPDWVSYPEATFGASLAMLFNLLPVNGAAGMGTQELGWVTGFNQFLSVDYDVALSTGIGVHLVQLFNIVAMGLVAHVCMGVLPKRRFDDE